MKIAIKLKASELNSIIELLETCLPEQCTDRMEAIVSMLLFRFLQLLKSRLIKLEKSSLTVSVEPEMAMAFVEFFEGYSIHLFSHAGNTVQRLIAEYDKQTTKFF